MKHARLPIAALLVSLLPATALAQAPADPGGAARLLLEHPGPLGPMAAGSLRPEHRLVKNLPYSAEVINERQQNLADGNQIVRKSVSASYRDSAGRIRQETRDERGELRSITIVDAAAGTTYVLNPQRKLATRIVAPQRLRAAVRERVAQLRKDGRGPAEANEIVIRRSEDDADNIRVAVDGKAALRVEASGMSTPNSNPRELVLGPLAAAFGDFKWAMHATTRELGSRDIDGVPAEGKLRSYEIPAGAVGNRQAIVVSDESWYAPQLQITVLSKHSDPRTGEVVYRVANLKREEPAASLFALPADYTVREVGAARAPQAGKNDDVAR